MAGTMSLSTSSNGPRQFEKHGPQDPPPETIVVGASGFIGRAFLAAYRQYDPTCAGTSHRPIEGLARLDLASPDPAPLALTPGRYRYALLAAGVTRLTACEREPELAYARNVTGTLELCRQLHEMGLIPIWFSSDCVFDGRAGGYRDDAPVSPMNVYGRQKAEVEARLPEICGKDYLIIRLGKVFGLEKGDGTLLDEMAALLAGGQRVRAAEDQIFCPIWIGDVVDLVLKLQSIGARGRYNLCHREVWNRFELACRIARRMGADSSLVKKISLKDLGEGLYRPTKTHMVCERLSGEIPYAPRPIRGCIEQVADHYRPTTEN
ncbi:MAG: dTDP-4-dehydrorhamnose reductase [Candidatus Kentron sp. G]|nr:MAG: dTDP-4-dehydrorhamnose reductase [Candidatus Kentron sp. G]